MLRRGLKINMSNIKQVSALAFTLLVKSQVLTEEEINVAKEQGYEGLCELLSEKILIVTGTLK